MTDGIATPRTVVRRLAHRCHAVALASLSPGVPADRERVSDPMTVTAPEPAGSVETERERETEPDVKAPRVAEVEQEPGPGALLPRGLPHQPALGGGPMPRLGNLTRQDLAALVRLLAKALGKGTRVLAFVLGWHAAEAWAGDPGRPAVLKAEGLRLLEAARCVPPVRRTAAVPCDADALIREERKLCAQEALGGFLLTRRRRRSGRRRRIGSSPGALGVTRRRERNPQDREPPQHQRRVYQLAGRV